MFKVFISVGMHNRSTEDVIVDIERARNKISRIYRGCGNLQIIDNFNCDAPENASRLYYLGEAIKKLGECDVCYFCKGWQNHKGCLIEMEICKLYRIDMIEEQ